VLERKLDEARVNVTTVRYDDFGFLNGLAKEQAVRSLFDHEVTELKHFRGP
jgi:hypothetical protein